MTIEEIFSKEQAKDIIAELKNGREVPAPDVDAAKKALNPDLHDVAKLRSALLKERRISKLTAERVLKISPPLRMK